MTEKERQNVGSDFILIIDALASIRKLKGNGGKIKCPKCKCNLSWSRSSYNKHVWGNCETFGCLNWAM